MPDMIRDGSGGGLLAKVNENLRLYTQAVTTSDNAKATEIGDSYNINTGLITLTNAAETPLVYIKNNGVSAIHITTIIIGTFASTAGSGTDGVPKAVFIRNPTTGTIITSTPTDVDINSNRNYGSSKALTVDAYKGATGDTMTDGADHIIVQMGTSGRTVVTIDELLPRGSSFGVKYTPQTSNTSQQVYCAVVCHIIDPKA